MSITSGLAAPRYLGVAWLGLGLPFLAFWLWGQAGGSGCVCSCWLPAAATGFKQQEERSLHEAWLEV